jgi:FtsZ-binding cell division protein ZapB
MQGYFKSAAKLIEKVPQTLDTLNLTREQLEELVDRNYNYMGFTSSEEELSSANISSSSESESLSESSNDQSL